MQANIQAHKKIETIALVGNPNSGKTSVFNQLTGLNQQIGNYPGITVDKKTGLMKLGEQKITVIDLPGTYSIYPRSEDERIVHQLLADTHHEDHPDLVIVIVDSSNLERNLLLFSQVYDLGIPVIMALNMMDVSKEAGITIDCDKLSESFGNTPVIGLSARKGEGFEKLEKEIAKFQPPTMHIPFYGKSDISSEAEAQIAETSARYEKISTLLEEVVSRKETPKSASSLTAKLDNIFVHPVWGYVIFVGILFLIFQAIYSLAEVPMDLIDGVFGGLSQWLKNTLPGGVLSDLLSEGIVPGIGGVVIFVPQIALLFAFIAILEETGYMSRVVFIMDKLMRPFGLNGRSVVPLISGVACAIPAIMATRTIDHWKDRLVTIMVTPLMSCSARLPVYTLLIALVIPDQSIGGVFNLKGLTLLGMYLLGLIAALGAAFVFRFLIKAKRKSFLILELPQYRMPRWRNVGITLWEKVRVFIWEAGKIIMAISIILWVLATYGPPKRIENAVNAIPKPAETSEEAMAEYQNMVQTVELENSWIGLLGKTIEPAIKPLGYDWKMGIALITSFAAREVFVGSMAIIYSIGDDFEESSLIQRLRNEKKADGSPIYTLAVGISLMLFYAFAMQCMSTLAIVYRETKSWKWPALQAIYMTSLAYICALIAFQLLS